MYARAVEAVERGNAIVVTKLKRKKNNNNIIFYNNEYNVKKQ